MTMVGMMIGTSFIIALAADPALYRAISVPGMFILTGDVGQPGPVQLATLAAVWPKSSFLPSSVTAGCAEKDSPFA
jgi:hypothetical protein